MILIFSNNRATPRFLNVKKFFFYICDYHWAFDKWSARLAGPRLARASVSFSLSLSLSDSQPRLGSRRTESSRAHRLKVGARCCTHVRTAGHL